MSVLLERDGVQAEEPVHKDSVITTIPMFRLPLPGYLSDPGRKSAEWKGVTLQVKPAPPRTLDYLHSLGAARMSVRQEFDVDSQARLLAKIAHVAAIGHLGPDSFDPWLPPYILGHDPCLPYVVGGITEDESPKDLLHDVVYEVRPHQEIMLVTVKIRLFSQLGGPYALVVTGSSTMERIMNRRPLVIGHLP